MRNGRRRAEGRWAKSRVAGGQINPERENKFFMECRHRGGKDHGRSASDKRFRSLSLFSWPELMLMIRWSWPHRKLKARHKISAADSWIIATAITRNATHVHKDPGFDALSDNVTMKTLPYKKTKWAPGKSADLAAAGFSLRLYRIANKEVRKLKFAAACWGALEIVSSGRA